MGRARRADTRGMSDAFNLGEPARRWTARQLDGGSAAPPPDGGGSGRSGLIVAAAVAVVLVVGAGVFIVLRGGAEAATERVETAVGALATTNDIRVQAALTSSSQAAMALLAQADPTGGGLTGGGPATDVAGPDALTAFDPSTTYTSGESTGPAVVSVANEGSTWAAASRSDSGRCLWIRLSDGVVTYGAGDPCTGASAMTASDLSW